MSDRPYKNVPTAELIESAKADLANVLVQLADPNSVHIAMLRGEVAGGPGRTRTDNPTVMSDVVSR